MNNLDLDYHSRLADLGIEEFQLRRLKQDLIMAYKILFGFVGINSNKLFMFNNTNYDLRGHAYKLFQGHCRIDIRQDFFTERVVRVWNSLLISDSNLTSVKSFSKFLDNCDFSEFLLS